MPMHDNSGSITSIGVNKYISMRNCWRYIGFSVLSHLITHTTVQYWCNLPVNLPRAEQYKLENFIIVRCIPGLIQSYLKPHVDDLLVIWEAIPCK